MSSTTMLDDESTSDDEEALLQEAQTMTTIPEVSRATYESAYKHFMEWLKESNIDNITEKVMLTYFINLSKTKKSTTLYNHYSKLKCMIYLNRNVDISLYSSLTIYLKRKNAGYVPKKSKMLTKSEFDRFISEANDVDYLAIKVALIIGIAAACRRDELLKLSTEDVVDWGELIQINIRDAKTRTTNQFEMRDSSPGNRKLMELLRRYVSLRKPVDNHDRFFVGYRGGKCTVQPIGINTIGAFPKRIAAFLGLHEAEMYTGHCFRRSSAGILAAAGSEFSVFKRTGVEGLRHMIPNYKQQSGSNATQTSSNTKLVLKSEPTSANERDSFEEADFTPHDASEVVGGDGGGQPEENASHIGRLQDAECELNVFSIKYVVPSSLIIRERQPVNQAAIEPVENVPHCSKDISRTVIETQPTDESDQDHPMRDDSDEILPDDNNLNSRSLSMQKKIDNLRLQEMENRVTESRLRCEAQRLVVSKAEEEFRHLQEMNKLRIQEAKLRLKSLEQSAMNRAGNIDPLNIV